MRFLDVIIADSHPIFNEGLKMVMSQQSGQRQYNLQGTASTGTLAAALMAKTNADLLILDINLPELNGLRLLPEIKKKNALAKILVLTDASDPRMVKAAFRAGADGYLLKSCTTVEFFEAVDEILRGKTFIGKGVMLSNNAILMDVISSLPEHQFAEKYGLTQREMEVMCLIGQAMGNKEIAEKLYISDQTVSVHRKNIMRKIGVNNTVTLIKIAYENHLV